MAIERLLRPRSVAIVGASERIGPGFNAWNALKTLGYAGAIHLVNPSRTQLLGQPCYPSLLEVPGEIDAVFIAVQAEKVVEVAREAAAKGAGGLAVLSSGFVEAGEQGAALQRELAALARAHDMAVCGPNCLGFLNFADRMALFGTSLPSELPMGGTAAIVQSGSIGIALLNAARGLGLSHLVTSGNEAVTTVADYLAFLAEEPAVQTIVVFLEQLREPPRFIAACRRARALGKPVIVLKSGRCAKGQQAVTAHTGAVAGSLEASDAALRAAGAVQVFSLDELIETAVAFAALPRGLKAPGAAVVSLSGGEIALALDAADAAGLALAPVSTARETLAALLPPGSHIANPLDLTWVGLYDASIARRCVSALGGQHDVGLIVLLQDAPRGLGEQQARRYATLLAAVADGAGDAGVPAVAVSNLCSDIHPDYARVATERSVASLRGTAEGIGAIAHRLRWQTALPTAEAPVATPVDGAARNRAAAALAAATPGVVLDESEANAVLAAYGIPTLPERLVASAEEAASALRELGGAIVIKALVPGIAHKSEHGLVRLDVRSEGQAEQVAGELLAKGRSLAGGRPVRLLVQPMIAPVAELLVGARIDPEFGPLVVAGLGGIAVELFKDVAVRLAPVSLAEAEAMLQATRAVRLLDGWRGKPKGDIAAAAEVVCRLSEAIADLAGEVREIEINPLAVMPAGSGCLPLDCLLVRDAARPPPFGGPRPTPAAPRQPTNRSRLGDPDRGPMG
jgi:acetate---CoA ligase (ADP-forming)